MDYDDSGEDPHTRPYLALLEAVLSRAILDIIRPEGFRFDGQWTREAAVWLYTNEELSPFSFGWICQSLRLDRNAVRKTVWLQLEEIANGTDSDTRIPSKLHELRALIQRRSVQPISRFAAKVNQARTSTASLVRAYKR